MSRLLIPAITLALVAVPSLASADTGSGLDAITDHAARQSAESIACTSQPARRYLRHALRDMDARRWGTVLTSLQGDTVDLVSDAIYAAASRPAGGDPIRTFVGVPAPACSENEQAAARRALDEPEENAPPTEVEKCLARPFAQRRRDPACSLAAAVRGALDGDASTARTHVADVIAATTFDALYTGKSLSEPQVDALFEHIAYALRQVILTRENTDTIEEDVARAFGPVDLDAVRGWTCKDDARPSAGDDRAKFCAATRADFRAPVVKVIPGAAPPPPPPPAAAQGAPPAPAPPPPAAPAEKTVDIDAAVRAAKPFTGADRDAKLAEAILCTAGVECAGGKVDAIRSAGVKIEVGDQTFTVGKPGGLSDAVAATGDIARLRTAVSVLVRDQLLGSEAEPAALRELAVVALRLRRVAHVLDEAVKSSDRNAFIVGPLEVLPALLPRFSDVAAVAPNSALARVTAGDLRPTIIAAEEGHLRELASRVSSLVGPRDRSTCIAPSSAGLLDAFAANVPEPRVHEDHWAGLEQIRVAAKEVATCTLATRPDPIVKFSLLPSPTIRASWNGAYRNAWGSDGFRVVPSLDFVSLSVRITPRASKVRGAVIISVFDAVAPLAELAMRTPNLAYDRQELIWLDGIRPRLDVSFSLPKISPHLSLVGGFALRTVAPYRGGGGKSTNTATYLAVGTPGGAASEAFSNYVEYSAGAKYSF